MTNQPNEPLRSRLVSLLDKLRHDSSFWRRALRLGAVHGPEPFVRYSPKAFGLLFFAALPQVRKKVENTLKMTTGHASAKDVATVFMNFASSITETFAVAGVGAHRLRAEVRGDEHFAEARALGKGVVLATAHTSGWYAAGPVLGSLYDEDVLVVMQRERDPAAEQVQAQARNKLRQRVIHVGEDPLAAMPLLAHLRRGGVVALQLDRMPPDARRRKVEFLSGTLEVPEGLIRLAALTGAPIVVVLGRRTGHFSYEISVSPRLEVPRRPTTAEVDAVAAQIAGVLGQFVTTYPHHWFRF